LSAGQRLGETDDLGGYREFQDEDGTFTLTGLPPGDVRVRVRAPGFRDAEAQTLTLAAGEIGAELEFTLEEGAVARGLVVDAATRAPVVGASVSASRARRDARGIFRASIEPEDFDFLGLMQGSRRSAVTDSEGRFELVGLAEGDYRFTARHPDRAKSSTGQDVTVADGAPTEGILIEFEEGGAIEGLVTGAGSRPLAAALIVAASIQAGSFKSASSTQEGRYRIDGLAPGQYIVFKSRMDEQSANIGLDLLANMRLKSVTVRPGRTARLDVHDAAEGTVRIHGTVRDAGQPVARAMVTALGTDREGVLGLGVRANPTDAEGHFELVGMEPGDYFIQVTRFDGRPQQASMSIEVPDGVASHRVDLDLPQSSIAGRVVDSRGAPVARVQITAGVEDGAVDAAPGLLGLVMRNAIAQTRTDEDGFFRLDRIAAGRYRVVASGRGFGRVRESGFGQAVIEGVEVDGTFPTDGLILALPRAGSITGVVVDGAGQPVERAEIVASPQERASSLDPAAEVLDLLGVQVEPVRSGPDGR
ncbi:MAG: carboxypeptidase regulatory-like domain-containing protein, partial [Planctomycetota bacterium]